MAEYNPRQQLAGLHRNRPRLRRNLTFLQRWKASRRSILLRFLRTSQERNVQHGLEQLTRTIKWRDEQNVAQILSNPEADKEELACRRLLRYSMKYDKAGRPILFQRIGAWNPATLCSAIESNKEALIRGHILMNERLACLSTRSWIEQRAEADKNGSSPSPTPPMLVLVIDMQDLGFDLMANGGTIFPVVQELFRIDGDYYPETTHRVFIVNAPMAFTALWGAIKYMVHPDSREKISVLGIEDSHPELIDLCGADFVPQELGGSLVDAAPYSEGDCYDGTADPTIFNVEHEDAG
jgi:hypothetical protein